MPQRATALQTGVHNFLGILRCDSIFCLCYWGNKPRAITQFVFLRSVLTLGFSITGERGCITKRSNRLAFTIFLRSQGVRVLCLFWVCTRACNLFLPWYVLTVLLLYILSMLACSAHVFSRWGIVVDSNAEPYSCCRFHLNVSWSWTQYLLKLRWNVLAILMD